MPTLTDYSRAVRPAKRPATVEEIKSPKNTDKGKVCAFDEYYEALRRIDQRILEAGGDASLEGFWLGLKREYQVEFDLLAQEVQQS
jgi:hypothetical protein